MTHTPRRWCEPLAAAVVLLAAAQGQAQDRVSETVHNLSVGGPGAVRAVGEGQVCIFCHAPHNTGGVRPLWNRELPLVSYEIYRSSTLDAKPGQPTGASKLCLSCHDGTIALGSVLSRTDRIRMVGGEYMPSGLTNLGTDLSDDHPVSFHFTSGLAASDRQLVSPRGLQSEIRLDDAGQLQCTSCHDPHRNLYGQFLVMPNEFGLLCTACHAMWGWASSSHRTSGATVMTARTGDWPYGTVAGNACRSCHRPHAAGGRERLLIHEAEEENCLSCHDGQVARTDIRAEIDKLSAHDPRRYQGIHDPVETLSGARRHVECADCHNPHAGQPPLRTRAYVSIGPTMDKVPGVTSGGGQIDEARHEYEVCFRCHGDSAAPTSRRIIRQVQQANLRLRFSPLNPSYHPVVEAVRERETVSLMPGMAEGSLIRCTDCHNNDTGPRAEGGGPDGPHGSRYDYLLERNYTVLDDTVESTQAYALCYKCHQRTSILSDRSFSLHRLHVVDERTPCSACHDPHGISGTRSFDSDHTHLINFDTIIVQPEPGSRRMEFRDLGSRSGSCTLLCHGVTHNELAYAP
ncbi:MAG: hypothetical protein JSU68_10190 [Phycisphaerales bacterium]|nr:MAG: hypothetical protein JSU68_10190 [Phycisphaerales bacterium]